MATSLKTITNAIEDVKGYSIVLTREVHMGKIESVSAEIFHADERIVITDMFYGAGAETKCAARAHDLVAEDISRRASQPAAPAVELPATLTVKEWRETSGRRVVEVWLEPTADNTWRMVSSAKILSKGSVKVIKGTPAERKRLDMLQNQALTQYEEQIISAGWRLAWIGENGSVWFAPAASQSAPAAKVETQTVAERLAWDAANQIPSNQRQHVYGCRQGGATHGSSALCHNCRNTTHANAPTPVTPAGNPLAVNAPIEIEAPSKTAGTITAKIYFKESHGGYIVTRRTWAQNKRRATKRMTAADIADAARLAGDLIGGWHAAATAAGWTWREIDSTMVWFAPAASQSDPDDDDDDDMGIDIIEIDYESACHRCGAASMLIPHYGDVDTLICPECEATSSGMLETLVSAANDSTAAIDKLAMGFHAAAYQHCRAECSECLLPFGGPGPLCDCQPF